MLTIRITHETTYQHAGPATAAWQMLQLQPRNEASQECLDFQLEIKPAAPDLTTRADCSSTASAKAAKPCHVDS